MHKLAIGITSYNNLDNITAIEKIYKLEDVNVYIVDDYSTDGLQTVYHEKGIIFKEPPQKVGGPGVGRNMILEQAINDGNQFITFVDGDDDIIIENILKLNEKLSQDIDMYYTSMLAIGYNNTLVPMLSGNYEFMGNIDADSLLLEENLQLRKQLLMGSGGRVYNLDIIKDFGLRYNPNKSGQDTLFNHHFFAQVKMVNFNNPSYPFYIYNIQMDSLSNNYRFDVLERRLVLIDEITKIPYGIYDKQDYADKMFLRYSRSSNIPETEKYKLEDIFSKFTGKEYSYVPTNDFLEESNTKYEFTRGLNIILMNSKLDIKANDDINLINISALNNINQIKNQLVHTKTIILDSSILEVSEKQLLEMIDNPATIIQPRYQNMDGSSAQNFDMPIYHGYSRDGFLNTITYVGTMFNTDLLLDYEFRFSNHLEWLVKGLFLSKQVPLIMNTPGFRINRFYNFESYSKAIVNQFNNLLYANTRSKIDPYTRLALEPIKKGNFVGPTPTFKSKYLTYEDASFIEAELEEFENFSGFYITNQNDEILEIHCKEAELNFTNLVNMKKIIADSDFELNKPIVNLPNTVNVVGYINMKLKKYTILFEENCLEFDEFTSSSLLEVETDVVLKGKYKSLIRFVDIDDKEVEAVDFVLKKGRYKLLFNKNNRKAFNELDKINLITLETSNYQNGELI